MKKFFNTVIITLAVLFIFAGNADATNRNAPLNQLQNNTLTKKQFKGFFKTFSELYSIINLVSS